HRAVALVRRDAEQHPRADLLADEAGVPAGDHTADADREPDRAAAVVGVVEHATAPDLTEVVDLDRLAGLDDRARALLEHLHLQVGRRRVLGAGQLGLVAEGAAAGGERRRHGWHPTRRPPPRPPTAVDPLLPPPTD